MKPDQAPGWLAGVLAVLIFQSPAWSQSVHDYFAPRDAQTEQLLGSNEGHHLGKGIEDLRASLKEPNRLQYAKGEFDFILRIWPNHPRVLGLMAETLIRMRRPDLIEPYFQRAFQMSPDAGPLHLAYGVSLLRRDKVPDAIKHLTRAAEADPGSADAHYNLGLALVKDRQLDKANESAQRAYALGFPLPGLRNQLEKAGAWKPLPPADKPGDAPSPQTPAPSTKTP